MLEVINGVVTVNDMEAFIIPNGAFMAKDILCDGPRNRMIMVLDKIGKASHFEAFDPEKDLLVDLWYCSKEAESDNICDHGFKITCSPDDLFKGNYLSDIKSLPVKWLQDLKEGEGFNMIVPYHEKIKFVLHITTAQSKYRYKNYGTFENAVNLSVDSYKK